MNNLLARVRGKFLWVMYWNTWFSRDVSTYVFFLWHVKWSIIFVIIKGLIAPTNPFSITNFHGLFYESEERHVDSSFENNTLVLIGLHFACLETLFKLLLLWNLFTPFFHKKNIAPLYLYGQMPKNKFWVKTKTLSSLYCTISVTSLSKKKDEHFLIWRFYNN